MLCHKCPRECHCQDYSVICTVNNTWQGVDVKNISYAKSITLLGDQNEIPLNKFILSYLVYIKVSNCNLEKISDMLLLTKREDHIRIRILFGNFSENVLTDISFLKAVVFKHLLVIDFANNLIRSIRIDTLTLMYLSSITLSGNLLKKVFLNMTKLSIVMLQNVAYQTMVNFYFDSGNDNLIIRVTDVVLCCFLSNTDNYVSNSRRYSCYGLLPKHYSRAIWYAMISVLFIFVVFFSLRQFKLSLSQTNAFQIASSNIAVANILMSAYLLVLVFADAFRVNVLSFRNQTCLVLNAVLYIASEMTRFCKVISIFLIMLKIRYPFKHQCIRVIRIAPLSLVILVISICLYMVFQNSCKLFSSCNFLFDQFCTLGMCHTKALHTLTPLLIFIFDLLFFISTCCILIITLFSLTSYKIHCSRNLSPVVLVMKIATLVSGEFLFRIFCCIIFLSKNSSVDLNEKFCLYVFLNILPVNTLYSGIAYEARHRPVNNKKTSPKGGPN